MNTSKPAYTVVPDSSKSRNEAGWFKARSEGITATQVAQLMVYGKLKPAPPASATPYMDWGTQREPHIIEAAQLKYQGEHIIPNDQVLARVDNPKYRATPDDFSENMIVECKTCKPEYLERFLDGTWKNLKNLLLYFYQVQWQMFIQGLDLTIIAAEERLGTVEEGFTPGRIAFVEVPRDDDAIKECIAAADKHLEEVKPVAPLPQPAAISEQTSDRLSELERWCQDIAASTFLPPDYRGNPANVMYAAEIADSLGLNRVRALNGLAIISGKPTMTADLMGELVRRAGHKLRISGDDTKATAVIIRADDPEFEYKCVWTIDRAKKCGLITEKSYGWRRYPAAMLRARATTEVARMGAQDALGGVIYCPEELGANVDESGEVIR